MGGAALPAERRVSARRGWTGERSGPFEHPHLSMWNSERVLTDMNVSHNPRSNHMVDSSPPA